MEVNSIAKTIVLIFSTSSLNRLNIDDFHSRASKYLYYPIVILNRYFSRGTIVIVIRRKYFSPDLFVLRTNNNNNHGRFHRRGIHPPWTFLFKCQ